jgi:tetratricopeptide (TPR) repeat protein
MAKNKKKSPTRPTGPRRASPRSPEVVVASSYEVTVEPLFDLPENRLPPEVEPQIKRLYEVVHSAPKNAIVELERLIERYPDCAKLYNFLGSAYQAIGEDSKAEQIAKKNYERFPDYLSARMNYADICLNAGRLDEFHNLFDGKYDLGLLYPKQKRIHLTEVVGFMGVVAFYFAKTGEMEQARIYQKTLRSLAPTHPYTKRIDRMMRMLKIKSFITNWI